MAAAARSRRKLLDHVTISGGNPALLSAIDNLIDLLQEKSIEVALETQGSRYQDWFVKIDDRPFLLNRQALR